MSVTIQLPLQVALDLGAKFESYEHGTMILVLSSKHDVSFSGDQVFIDSGRSLIQPLLDRQVQFIQL